MHDMYRMLQQSFDNFVFEYFYSNILIANSNRDKIIVERLNNQILVDTNR